MQGISGISGGSIGAMMCQLSDILDDPAMMEKLGLSPAELEMIVSLLERLENMVSDGIQPEEVDDLKKIIGSLSESGLGDSELVKKIEDKVKELTEDIRDDGAGVPPLQDLVGGFGSKNQTGAISPISSIPSLGAEGRLNDIEINLDRLGNSLESLDAENTASQGQGAELNYFAQMSSGLRNRRPRGYDSSYKVQPLAGKSDGNAIGTETKEYGADLKKSPSKKTTKKSSSEKQKKAIVIIEDVLTYLASGLLGRLKESSKIESLMKDLENKAAGILDV